MKRLVLLLTILIGFGGIAHSYENTYALIVGVADYKYEGIISDLNYTVKDAKSFYSFLIKPEGGSVPKENICVLLDTMATKKNIMRNAKALFSKANANDRVIFYFSGHGGKGFFCPYDFNGYVDKALTYDDVKTIFRNAKSNTKLMFADACHSGGIKKGTVQAKETDSTENSNMNIAIMLACSDDEMSGEGSELEHGLFTYYLMKGLGGDANRDGNKYITIQELYYYVYAHVKEKSEKMKYKDGQVHIQTPQLFGNFDLRIIVGNVVE